MTALFFVSLLAFVPFDPYYIILFIIVTLLNSPIFMIIIRALTKNNFSFI